MAKHKKRKTKHRNAPTGSLAAARRPRAPARASAEDDEIDFGTIAAALGGGLGGAFAGGWLAARGWTPEAVSAVMAVGGGVAATLTDGPMRIASMGVAAAGAGQFALTLFGEDDGSRDREKAIKVAAEKLAADQLAAEKTAVKATTSKPANARLPYGPEEAFQRARTRLATLHEDEATDRYADA
ncbi:MAG: hypothetical protein HS111_26285 [Kofleriaceae bacterium]|nr:hypothetical protein [Kofleriaceae bacterium]MCL4227289.1 hypothetical protein [Myxococcales bacterium]